MSNEIRDGSTTVDVLQRAQHWLTSTAEQLSTVAQTVISGSFIYQWLTAEPEPEVIVIDLRETWTVGPIITLIDRFIQGLTQSVQTSTFVRGTQTSMLVGGVHNGTTAFREQPINVVSLIVIAGALGLLLVGAVLQMLSIVSAVVLVLLALIGMFGVGAETTLQELRETKAAQLLISAFEPPEPPSAVQSETTGATHETDADDTEAATNND